MYIDAMPQVKALAQKTFGYTGRKFQVHAAESVRCNSHWDGGSRSYFAIIRGDGTGTLLGQSGTMFDQGAVPDVKLDYNTLVLEHVISCGKDFGITVHVHPSRFPLYLPAGPDELSREELIVLVATHSLKSSYGGVSNLRYVEAHRETGISLAAWDSAKQDLIDKGYLTKAGAATVSGKNAAGSKSLWELRF